MIYDIDEKCKKCGECTHSASYWVDYINEDTKHPIIKEGIVVTCLHCGFKWDTEPHDYKAADEES